MPPLQLCSSVFAVFLIALAGMPVPAMAQALTNVTVRLENDSRTTIVGVPAFRISANIAGSGLPRIHLKRASASWDDTQSGGDYFGTEDSDVTTQSAITPGMLHIVVGPLAAGITYDIRVASLDFTTSMLSAWVESLGHRIPDPAGLRALTISAGALMPAFNSNVKAYTLAVDNTVETVTVTPTVEVSGATVTVKTGDATAAAVDSGSASAAQSLDVGENIITIAVSGGGTSAQYIITVTRAPPAANHIGLLSALRVHDGMNNLALTKVGGTADAGFASMHADYSTPAVLFAVRNVTITPTLSADSGGASIAVSGLAVADGMASMAQELAVGANAFTITVTAANASSMDYRVAIMRGQPSSVNLLGGIAINDGSGDLTLTKTGALTTAGFDADHLTYQTPNVEFAVSSVTITATADSASIGASVAGGGARNLVVGVNTLEIVVTAENGETRTYTLEVTRNPDPSLSGDATLTGLRITRSSDGGEIPYYPALSADVTEYVARTQIRGRNEITLLLQAAADATLAFTAPTQITGDALALTPNNTAIATITVTSQNMLVQKVYTVAIEAYSLNANANLAALSLSPVMLTPNFNAAQTNYSVRVPNNIANVSVSATHANPFRQPAGARSRGGFLSINGVDSGGGGNSGDIALGTGETNMIPVVVTAEDFVTTKTYVIAVTRADANANSDSTLSALAISPGTLEQTFAATTQTYTASFPFATAEIMVTAAAADSVNAIVTVNNSPLAAGANSAALPLTAGGVTEIPVVVTAENGGTQTYTLRITREAASADATLSALILSRGVFAPEFMPAVLTYAARIPVMDGSVTVTPTVAATGFATVTINAATVTDNTASAPIAITTGGVAEISIVVTAESGGTQTYIINITGTANAAADVNVDGMHDSTDGLLIARYLLGMRGDALTGGIIADISIIGTAEIEARIAAEVAAKSLDVNGDGVVTAADGILISRYFLGVRGDALGGGQAAAGVDVETNIKNLQNLGAADVILPQRKSLDVNADLENSWHDSIAIARYLSGTRGDALTRGIFDTAATANIETRIAAEVRAKTYDVNGDSVVNIADGILIARYLLGVRGDALTVGTGAGVDAETSIMALQTLEAADVMP